MGSSKKTHLSRVTSLIIAAIFIANISVSENTTLNYKNLNNVDNLATQRVFNPPTGETLLDRAMLDAAVMHAVLKNRDVLNSKYDMVSYIYNKRLDIGFSRAGRVTKIKDPDNELFILPCHIEERPYFVYLAKNAKNVFEVKSVLAKEEYKRDLENIAGLSSEQPEVFDNLPDPGYIGSDLAFIDITDDSARRVSRFFSSIGLAALEKDLGEILRSQELLVSGKIKAVPYSIVIDTDESDEEKAGSILRYVFAARGISPDVAARFEDALASFIQAEKKKENFDIDLSLHAELVTLLQDLEKEKGSSSNEGLMLFHNQAYLTMVNTEDLEVEDCYSPVQADIRSILTYLANYASAPGEKMPEFQLRAGEPAGEPGEFSKNMFTTMRVAEKPESEKIDGEKGKKIYYVTVNPYFIKVMWRLGGRGLHKNEGMVGDFDYDPENPKFIGELYNSILYSVIMHEVMGHFRIGMNGEKVYNPDELWAQAQRGHGHLYMNLLAIAFYWFVVLERSPYPELRATLFMEEHPEVFIRLTEKEKAQLPLHLKKILDGLRKNKHYDGFSLFDVTFTPTNATLIDYFTDTVRVREPIKDDREKSANIRARLSRQYESMKKKAKLSPYDLFQILENTYDDMDFDRLARRANVEDIYVYEALAMLMSYGLVYSEDFDRKTGKNLDSPVYRIAPMKRDEREAVRDILKEAETEPRAYIKRRSGIGEISDIGDLREKIFREVLKRIDELGSMTKGGELSQRMKIRDLRGLLDDILKAQVNGFEGKRIDELRKVVVDMIEERITRLVDGCDLIFKKIEEVRDLSPEYEVRERRKEELNRLLDEYYNIKVEKVLEGELDNIRGAVNDLLGARVSELKTLGVSLLEERYGEIKYVKRRLSETVDFETVKTKIFHVTEARWAQALAYTSSKLSKEKENVPAEGESAKILIAIETDWIPKGHPLFTQGFIQELDELERSGRIRVVRGTKSDIITKINKVKSDEKIRIQDVVVLASRASVEAKLFDRIIKGNNDKEGESPFLAGVDPKNIKEDSYIRLVEMITCALRMAYGYSQISDHPHIRFEKQNERMFFFIPKAEKLDLGDMNKIYERQKEILIRA